MWPTILATANPFLGWVSLRKYFPLSQTGSAIIACRASSFRAIFWALWLELQAMGIAEKDLSGNVAQNCNNCIPPIDPPVAHKSFLIPRCSRRDSCALTMSLIVITGKSKP